MTKQPRKSPDPTHKNPTPRPVPRRGQIAHVHIAKNGMLSAADENGNDLPQFGGPSEEVLPEIQKVYSGPVSREE
jgi:hypothetical protein